MSDIDDTTAARLRELSDPLMSPNVSDHVRQAARTLLQAYPDAERRAYERPLFGADPERAKTVPMCCTLAGTAILAAATVWANSAPR